MVEQIPMYRNSSNIETEEETKANTDFERNHDRNNSGNRQSLVSIIMKFQKEKEDLELMGFFNKRLDKESKKEVDNNLMIMKLLKSMVDGQNELITAFKDLSNSFNNRQKD